MKTYKIADLLDRQPKAFKKKPEFALLNVAFTQNAPLQKLTLSPKLYRDLNFGRLPYKQVDRLCKTHHITNNVFFAMFVKFKLQYVNDAKAKKRAKLQKTEKILAQMSSQKKSLLKIYLVAEKKINKKITLWRSYFYNISYKKATTLANCNNLDFYSICSDYLNDFAKKYHEKTDDFARFLVYFAFELPYNTTEPAVLKNQYRKLSKIYHPDVGGSEQNFKLLQNLYNQCLSFSIESGFFSK